MDNNYEYDLAISFLAEDESIANQIYFELNQQFNVFFYPTNQKEIVAKDGVDLFSSVFLKKSRLNLILYRQKWGTTKWTRIEESAIKTRVFDSEEGWDSLFFIKLEEVSNPSWIPPTYIYGDFKNDDFKELIGIIKYRVLERGGIKSEETLLELAKRKKNERELQKEIEAYLSGDFGLENANKEVLRLFEIFETKHKELQSASVGLAISNLKREKLQSSFQLARIHLTFHWSPYYQNSLDEAYLEIIIYPHTNGRARSFLYSFAMNNLKQIGWIQKGSSEFFSSENLIEFWMKEHFRIAINE